MRALVLVRALESFTKSSWNRITLQLCSKHIKQVFGVDKGATNMISVRLIKRGIGAAYLMHMMTHVLKNSL